MTAAAAGLGLVQPWDFDRLLREMRKRPKLRNLRAHDLADVLDMYRLTRVGGGGTALTGYFVDPVNGSDANPGTEASPWRTIEKAFTGVPAGGGHTVWLRGGTYIWVTRTAGTITTPVAGTALARNQLRAYPGEVATIRGVQTVRQMSYWTIGDGNPSDLRWMWHSGDTSADMVRVIAGTGSILDGIEIGVDGSSGVASTPQGGILIARSESLAEAPTNLTVRNCVIHDTTGSGIYCNPSRSSTGIVIERNLLHNAGAGTGASGIKLGWGGTDVNNASNAPQQGVKDAIARYNTIVNATVPITVAEAMTGFVHVHRNLLVNALRTTSIHLIRLDSVEGFLGGGGSGTLSNGVLDPGAEISIFENYGYESTSGYTFITDLGGDGPITVAMADDGGNIVGTDPLFNNTTDYVNGFRPGNATAALYGRFA